MSLSTKFRAKAISQDRVVGAIFLSFSLLGIATTFLIFFTLLHEARLFFAQVSLKDFFGTLEWSPLIEPRTFGIWPLVSGTFMICLISSLVAVPLGLGTSVYLSEFATRKTRGWMKPLLDLLAGIPSVVYGFFAVSILTPLLQKLFPSLDFFNSLSAGIVVGLMILPLVTSLSEEALRSVPKELRHAAWAMGVSKTKTIRDIVLPAASSGVFAAFLLGLARAIGETMAVTLAAGSTPNLSFNPMEGIQTLTAFIAQVSLGDTPVGSIEYESMYAVGLYLFLSTFLINVIARMILKRVRMRYE